MLVNFLKKSFEFNQYNSRNNQGKIVTYRRKKFKLKKKFKPVDLKRFFFFTPARVLRFLTDSKKSSFLALVYLCDFGMFSYILSSQNLRIGNLTSSNSLFRIGSSCLLKFLPLGSKVFNINLHRFSNGQLARSAGVFANLFRKIKLFNGAEFVGLQLPSGAVVYVSALSTGTLGMSSNERFNTISGLGARSLKLTGRRPRVRGVAMNPVDHPHGGGEGKTSGGRISVSRWGLLAKGGKTLNTKKKLKRLKFLRRLKQGVC